jgi:hypothetical protein
LTHLFILLTQHPNLLLLRKDQRPDTGWRRQPVSSLNSRRRSGHRKQSPDKMQTGIRLPSRSGMTERSHSLVPPPEGEHLQGGCRKLRILEIQHWIGICKNGVRNYMN